MITAVRDQFQTGIFFANSKTSHSDILDGSSNTLLVGERSKPTFQSIWSGVIAGATNPQLRVVGWTGEPPNYDSGSASQSGLQFHSVAQFNSVHNGGLTMFAFADGAVKTIPETIDFEVFHAMGTINGRDN